MMNLSVSPLALYVLVYCIVGWLFAVNCIKLMLRVAPQTAYGVNAFPKLVKVYRVIAFLLWPVEIIGLAIAWVAMRPYRPAKERKVKPLERIADCVESILERLLNDLEYARERISGLEQSNRDIRSNYDTVREERDTANRSLTEARQEVARLNLTTPPTVAPPTVAPPPLQG
jgi:hypothetical protein